MEIDNNNEGNPSGESGMKKSKVERVKFVVHDFLEVAYAAQAKDEKIYSPIFQAHGFKWTICLFPIEFNDAMNAELYILRIGEDFGPKVSTDCTFRVQGERIMSHRKFPVKQYYSDFPLEAIGPRYLEHDGSMIVEVTIKVHVHETSAWHPEDFQSQGHLVHLYHNPSETADVTFVIPHATDPAEYPVHRSVLNNRAMVLFEIANDFNSFTGSDGDSHDCCSKIPISNVEKHLFEILLEFVYTVRLPEFKDIDITKKILAVADRFCCTELKLYTEWTLVNKFLTAETAAELLVLADAYSCALLKEASLCLFVSDPFSVIQSKGWSIVQDSSILLEQLFDTLAEAQGRPPQFNVLYEMKPPKRDPKDVFSLRRDLQNANLEIDGTREALMRRLKGDDDDSDSNAGSSYYNFSSIESDNASVDSLDSMEDNNDRMNMVGKRDIQISMKKCRTWYPKAFESQGHLVHLYHNPSETADVTFVIPHATDPAEYPVHRSVLNNRAMVLFEIANDFNSFTGSDGDSHDCCSKIPISNVEKHLFEILLEFVYTVRLPEFKDIDITKKILAVADRFCCTELKLFAESTLVDEFLTAETAAELLVLADAHSCALLQEASLRAIALDPLTVKSTEAWSSIQASNKLLNKLLHELADAQTEPAELSGPPIFNNAAVRDHWEHKDVAWLRRKLQHANLEVDGSREILMERFYERFSPHGYESVDDDSLGP